MSQLVRETVRANHPPTVNVSLKTASERLRQSKHSIGVQLHNLFEHVRAVLSSARAVCILGEASALQARASAELPRGALKFVPLLLTRISATM